MNVSDSQSGISSSKYCVTTGSSCTPSTSANLSSNTYTVTLGTNASAQKVCVNTTDAVGNVASTSCSSSYSVDTTDPTAKISASVSGTTITVSASGSFDSESGLATYYYSKDGGSSYISSSSSSYTFTGLSDGTYTLVLKVADKSGRMSSAASTTATVITYHNVNVLAGPGGSISAFSKVATGGSVSFSATPSSGYSTYAVSCNASSGSVSGNTVSVSSVYQDSVCVVSFKKNESTSSCGVIVQTGKQTNSSTSITCGDSITFGLETDGPDVKSITLGIYNPSGTALATWTNSSPAWYESKTISGINAAGSYKITHYAQSYNRTVSATCSVSLSHTYTIFNRFITVPTCSSSGTAEFRCRGCGATQNVTLPAIRCS